MIETWWSHRVPLDKQTQLKCVFYILSHRLEFTKINSILIIIPGVQKLMVPGTSVKSSREALRLTRLYPGTIYSTAGKNENGWDYKLRMWLIWNIYFTGIHPLDSKSVIEEPESWKEYEETIANQPECVAIGPCGLDYQRDFSEPDVQKLIFEKQLELAVKLNKPVLIHERSAQADVLDVLTK